MKRLEVCVLGVKGVGKTSLYRSVSRSRTMDEKLESIRGTDIYEFPLEEGEYDPTIYWVDETWKKEVLTDLNKLAFTNETLFVVVLDIRRSVKENKIEFLLKEINTKFPKAEILPILTNIDKIRGKKGLLETKERTVMDALFSSYGENVLSSIKVSNRTGENITEVRNVLKKKLLKR